MRFFRQVSGQKFGAYLAEYRVARAQAMLDSSDLSITEVAHAAGFCDQSYFGLVFRRLTGMTPGEYRQRSIQEPPRATSSSPRDG
jgi:AraC-like DNA-binding protein